MKCKTCGGAVFLYHSKTGKPFYKHHITRFFLDNRNCTNPEPEQAGEK